MKRTRASLYLYSLFFGAVAASYGVPDDLTNRLDQIFSVWAKPGSPGVSVSVSQHGKLVFEKGYGLANLEYDIPVTPQTVYHVASVSKQFTAMALVLLEEEHKLSLEDDVHKYLPELPDYGHPVTLRQLLQHTSGIRDQWQTLAIAGWRLDDVITQKQILNLLFHQKELNFVPGSTHLYSNGGYTLAAEVVARVSGKTFPDFCQERIFAPLAMTRSHFHDDHRRIVPDRAYSYANAREGYEASPLNYANAGATSLFTTASDLARWLDNFREPKVGGRAALDRLEEQAVLSNGQKIDYALGLALGEYRGLKTVSHSGGDAGYRSFVLWFPAQELGIAVLGGLGSFDAGGTGYRVAEEFLGSLLKPEPKQKPSQPAPEKPSHYVSLDPSLIEHYLGHYKLDGGLEVDVRKKDGKLFADMPGQGTAELRAITTNRFFVEEVSGEVEFLAKPGGPLKVKFVKEGTLLNGERTALTPWESKSLDDYPGIYWSDELEAQYTVRLQGGKLKAIHVRHGEIELIPAAQDCFKTTEWFMPQVNFLRDASNHVCGLTLGGGRVVAIRFNKTRQ